MSLQPKPCSGFEDCLAAERDCIEEEHEYLAGQVFAMTWATYSHNSITANVARELSRPLTSRPCTALASEMPLGVQVAAVCAYPDSVVLCEAPVFHDQRRDLLTNATLAAEILSPATEGYDRGGKLTIDR